LPESIDQLQQLTHFDLSNNRLSELPDEIGDLSDLRLDGNPLSDSLTTAVQSGPDAVLDYLLAKGTRLYEAKLLIVGEADAGKTSLARKLLDPAAPLPEEDEATLGIDVVRDWRFTYVPDPQVSDRTTGGQVPMMSANIWDFGGQENPIRDLSVLSDAECPLCAGGGCAPIGDGLRLLVQDHPIAGPGSGVHGRRRVRAQDSSVGIATRESEPAGDGFRSESLSAAFPGAGYRDRGGGSGGSSGWPGRESANPRPAATLQSPPCGRASAGGLATRACGGRRPAEGSTT